MKDSEMELLLRSFDDDDLDASERRRLEDLLEQSAELRAEEIRLRRLRAVISGSAADAFEPDFADRVMTNVARASMASSRVPRTRKAHDHAADLRHAPDRHSVGRVVEMGERISGWMAGTASSRASGWMAVHRTVWMAGGAATVIVLLIAVGLFVRIQPKTMSVPYGEMQMVELRDGSLVELSGGSTLTYPGKWESGERRVRLDGEAYFDVIRQDVPFVVQTFNADVTVLGTQFNVRAWEDDPVPETAVTLAAGRVAVTPRRDDQKDDRANARRMAADRADGDRLEADRADADRADADVAERLADDRGSRAYDGVSRTDDRPAAAEAYEYDLGDDRQAAESMLSMSRFAPGAVVLEPGQTTSVIADSAAAPRSASIDRVLAWRSGGLAFVDQRLGSVFKTIERRFDVDVEPLDPAIRNRLLTYLNPFPESAEEVISDICHTLDLRYRRTANGYEILPDATQ